MKSSHLRPLTHRMSYEGLVLRRVVHDRIVLTVTVPMGGPRSNSARWSSTISQALRSDTRLRQPALEVTFHQRHALVAGGHEGEQASGLLSYALYKGEKSVFFSGNPNRFDYFPPAAVNAFLNASSDRYRDVVRDQSDSLFYSVFGRPHAIGTVTCGKVNETRAI